jgi:hypothetical protein
MSARPPTPANRFGLDYRAEAAKLGRPVVPIIDAHTHIHGERASRIYDEVRKLFGVVKTYSMTQVGQAPTVREALGDTVRFIAIPTWSDPEKASAHGMGYIKTIERFRREFDSRMLKIWGSPRLRDIVTGEGAVDVRDLDSPARIAACEAGRDLGMMYMVHIADPDTWFATKYADPAKYGTKRSHYEALERMLDRFESPWIAAHMGGWPEDLNFLDGLLTRHPNLYIDTSATKWVVRELGKYFPGRTRAFFTKWRGRVLFGSDLVVMEDQLSPAKTGVGGSPMGDLADSPESAFELYASRYFTLRTMFETSYEGESPIADPDLMMVEPEKYDAMSAPMLRGLGIDRDLLSVMYAGAAERLVEEWWRTQS